MTDEELADVLETFVAEVRAPPAKEQTTPEPKVGAYCRPNARSQNYDERQILSVTNRAAPYRSAIYLAVQSRRSLGRQAVPGTDHGAYYS
jgi:hypothetical protein